ncbi:hypothetical protein [Bradyrhizobium sp.]|uniref:hypothetical protein n=1 Tax=Bradyrhizobium sp. TaxID=376 RepID=UPI003BB03CE3
MGSGRTGSTETPDLFSTASPEETASRAPKPTASLRHALPKDLPAAIKYLNDQELEQLFAAVIAEQQRRGKKQTAPGKSLSKRVEEPSTTLTIGKLNAVRAAFKAGVTPSKIAKQFGIPRADVRKVIANEGIKR